MDKASAIGLAIAVGALGFVFFEASHGHLSMFYSQEGVLMVFGGSVSVVFMGMPMSQLKSLPSWLKKFMFHKGRSPVETAKILADLSERARRDGILALESEVSKIQDPDPFLIKGLKMAIDGIPSENIEATLKTEIMAMGERHKAGKKFFDLIKLYGPGYGLVGTLVGQVGMFGNLGSGDIGQMGKMLAVAVVATMYGAVLANAIAGPMGDKLGARSNEEIMCRKMILQGILSLQAGDNPRMTLDKMAAFLPNDVRGKLAAAA